MEKREITPGEFADPEDVTLQKPEDEKEFDDGVSASFLRFDGEENQDGHK